MRRAVSDVYLVFPVRFPHRSLSSGAAKWQADGRRGGRASCHPPPRCMRRGAVITGASSEFPPTCALPPFHASLSLPPLPSFVCVLGPLSLSGGVRIAL